MDATLAPPPPFKGLITYADTADDARLFFGRDREQGIVRANLMAFRLTVFYGPTGVGKSSLLNAGVVHPLREQARRHPGADGLPDFCVVTFRDWREDPSRGLVKRVREALEEELSGAPGEGPERARRLLGGLPPPGRSLSESLKSLTEGLGVDLFIVLDQFEEYFIYHPREEGAGTFDVELARAVGDRSLRVNFLISIREEWVAKLDRFKGPLPSIFENNLRLKHLDRVAAAAAISEPMKVYRQLLRDEKQKVGIPREVEQEVLDDLQKHGGAGGPGDAGLSDVVPQEDARPAGSLIQAPYLQLLMRELWEGQRSRDGSYLLQSETLKRLGGVNGVRRNYVIKKLGQMSAAERHIAAGIFRFLVTSSGTKYAQPVSNLAAWSETDPAALTPVLEKLSGPDFNLLRRTDLRDTADPHYEVVHDLLAPAIHEWAADHHISLKLERLRREEKERERTKRLRLGFITTLVMCLALGGVSVFAFQQRNEADRQRKEAERLGREESQQKLRAEVNLEDANKQREAAVAAQRIAQQAREEADADRLLAQQRESEAKTARAREARERERAETAEASAKAALERSEYRARTETVNRLGLGELRAGRVEQALELFMEANKRYAIQKDASGQASSLASIGDAYAALGSVTSLSLFYTILQKDDFDGQRSVTGAAANELTRLILSETGKKQAPEQKAEAAAARDRALKQYEVALEAYRDKTSVEDIRGRASVQKRLGDIYFFLSDEKDLEADKDKNLRKAVERYAAAAADHLKVGEHVDGADALRMAGDLLSSEVGRESSRSGYAEDVNRVDELYRGASESYRAGSQPLKAATVLVELGEFYESLPDDHPRKVEETVEMYREAHEILAGQGKHSKEAEVAIKIAETYKGLKRKDEAIGYYEAALKAHLLPDSPGQKKGEAVLGEYTLSNAVNYMRGISAADRESAGQSFERVLKVEGQDAAARARLLHVISRAYTGGCGTSPPRTEVQTADCAAAVKFLRQERDAWRALGDRSTEAETLFELAAAHERESNREEAVRALDEAFAVRRGITAAPLPAGRDVVLEVNVRSGAELYETLGEHRKAAEAYSILLEAYLKSSAGTRDGRVTGLTRDIARNYLKLPGGAPEAEATFGEVLAAARKAQDTSTEILLLRAAGEVYGAAKNPRQARPYLEQERLLQLSSKRARDALGVLLLLSRFYTEAGEKGEAERYLAGVAENARAAADPLAEATARHALGDFYRDDGQTLKAIAEYELAGAAYRAADNSPFLEPKVVEELVKLYEKSLDAKKVEASVAALIALHEKPDAGSGVRESLAELIEFYRRAGDVKKEKDLIEVLIKLSEKQVVSERVKELKERLTQLSGPRPQP